MVKSVKLQPLTDQLRPEPAVREEPHSLISTYLIYLFNPQNNPTRNEPVSCDVTEARGAENVPRVRAHHNRAGLTGGGKAGQGPRQQPVLPPFGRASQKHLDITRAKGKARC